MITEGTKMTDTATVEAPSAIEAARMNVGRTGMLDIEKGLQMEVRILGVKSRYGHTDMLVTPVAGNGEAWVEATRVVICA
jgi:hypothetical protein